MQKAPCITVIGQLIVQLSIISIIIISEGFKFLVRLEDLIISALHHNFSEAELIIQSTDTRGTREY